MQAGWVDGISAQMEASYVETARRLAGRMQRLALGARVISVANTARVRTARHAMELVGGLQAGDAAVDRSLKLSLR